MAAKTNTAAKTAKGARAKVQKGPAPAKPAGRAAASKPKTTAKAATGAKTARGARAKVQSAPKKSAPVKATSIAEKKPWKSGAKINPKTGFTTGTISDKIATALLKGGKSRVDIVNSIADLPTETKKGTKFQAANVAATVERQMVRDFGFTVSQSYKLVPPKRGS